VDWLFDHQIPILRSPGLELRPDHVRILPFGLSICGIFVPCLESSLQPFCALYSIFWALFRHSTALFGLFIEFQLILWKLQDCQ